MKIRVADIGEDGRTVRATIPAAALPVIEDIRRSGDGTLTGPVAAELTAVRAGDMIEIEGRLTVRLRMPCSRCLAEHETDLQIDAALTYAPETAAAGVSEREFEISAQDADLLLYSGEEIDLTDGIQQLIVLALPRQSLCRPDCKGLCAGCGADLNREPCRCEPPVDPRWAALKNVKVR